MTSHPADRSSAPGASGRAWRVRSATADDAGELHTLTLAAFVTEAQRYRDALLPPLRETLSEVAAAVADPAVVVLVAEADGGGFRPGRLLGAVRVRLAGEPPVGHLGRLVVAPDARGRGLGSALVAAAEDAASTAGAEAVELFTGAASAATIALYQRAGYAQVTGAARTDDRGVALVVLRKPLGDG